MLHGSCQVYPIYAIVYRAIDNLLHTLEDHIQDSMDEAQFSEGTPLYVACVLHSEGYKDWALGYRIILCAVLQVCVAHTYAESLPT